MFGNCLCCYINDKFVVVLLYLWLKILQLLWFSQQSLTFWVYVFLLPKQSPPSKPASVSTRTDWEGGGGGAACSLINFGGTQVPLEKRDAQEQHDWPNTRMLPFPHWQSAYKGCLFNTLKYVIIGNMLNLHKPTILVY